MGARGKPNTLLASRTVTLVVLGAGWLCGLVAVAAFGAPWWMGAAWLAAIAPAVRLQGGISWRLIGSAAGCAAIAGALMVNGLRIEPPPLAGYLGEEVEILGTIISEPDPGRVSTSYDVEVHQMSVAGKVLVEAGVVRATLHQYARHLPGDRVSLRGKLTEAPVFDGFDYRSYLQNRGIWATMLYPSVEVVAEGGSTPGRELSRIRLALDRSLQRSLPEPEASLAAGIAFGRDGNLSMERKEAFNTSGLRHLVAVSGSNISLVAGMTVAIAVPVVGRKWAWIPAGLTIAVYLLVAGFAPSVVRAGIMAWILLLGGIIGRPQSGLPALAAALILMTAFDPRNALDAGFQLSMAATAGLLTVAPWLAHWFERGTARLGPLVPPRWATEIAALSVAASLATAPIMWAQFGQLSLVSPLANVIVQPALLVAFWLSLLASVAGLQSDAFGWLVGLAAYYPLAFIDNVATIAASLPLAAIEVGRASPIAATLVMFPMAVAAGFGYRFLPPPGTPKPVLDRRRERSGRLIASATAGAFALAVIPISLMPMGGGGNLRLDFLAIGQGDAILVTTPGGYQLLIDGGPSGIDLSRELSAVLPHWDRHIDAALLSHPQEDHIGGLPEFLQRFAVDTVYTSGHPNRTRTFTEFERTAAERMSTLSAGRSFEVDGVVFEVLWPDATDSRTNLNDLSLVLRLTYGEVTILLTGDIEGPVQRQLMRDYALQADVLKVPHHGSRTSDLAFLAFVEPQVAIIQAGLNNRFGHPHEPVLEALAGSLILRTDTNGTVTVTTDGSAIRVRSER